MLVLSQANSVIHNFCIANVLTLCLKGGSPAMNDNQQRGRNAGTGAPPLPPPPPPPAGMGLDRPGQNQVMASPSNLYCAGVTVKMVKLFHEFSASNILVMFAV